MFGNRRHFRELLGQSDEGIASNILADRLKRLVSVGVLSRRDDPTHKQKTVYSLTEMGIEFLPLLWRWEPGGAATSPLCRSSPSGSSSWKKAGRSCGRIS
jgi:DNA-binding HxlR family transcriptional regulator